MMTVVWLRSKSDTVSFCEKDKFVLWGRPHCKLTSLLSCKRQACLPEDPLIITGSGTSVCGIMDPLVYEFSRAFDEGKRVTTLIVF